MENAAAGKNRRRTRLHHRPAPPPAGRQCTSLDVSQFQTSPQRRKLFPTDYVHDSNMVPSNLSNFALSTVASLGKYRMLRSSILCVHAISTRAEKKLKITKNIENTFVWRLWRRVESSIKTCRWKQTRVRRPFGRIKAPMAGLPAAYNPRCITSIKPGETRRMSRGDFSTSCVLSTCDFPEASADSCRCVASGKRRRPRAHGK